MTIGYVLVKVIITFLKKKLPSDFLKTSFPIVCIHVCTYDTFQIGHKENKKDLLSRKKDVFNHNWYTVSISNTKEVFIVSFQVLNFMTFRNII